MIYFFRVSLSFWTRSFSILLLEFIPSLDPLVSNVFFLLLKYRFVVINFLFSLLRLPGFRKWRGVESRNSVLS